MAHIDSKGYYVQKLKEHGISLHPKGLQKLEKYKTSEVRNLYFELVVKSEND